MVSFENLLKYTNKTILVMAKKTVATLQTASKRLSKAIKMVKSPKTGAYTFVESIMAPELVDEFLKNK